MPFKFGLYWWHYNAVPFSPLQLLPWCPPLSMIDFVSKVFTRETVQYSSQRSGHTKPAPFLSSFKKMWLGQFRFSEIGWISETLTCVHHELWQSSAVRTEVGWRLANQQSLKPGTANMLCLGLWIARHRAIRSNLRFRACDLQIEPWFIMAGAFL